MEGRVWAIVWRRARWRLASISERKEKNGESLETKGRQIFCGTYRMR